MLNAFTSDSNKISALMRKHAQSANKGDKPEIAKLVDKKKIKNDVNEQLRTNILPLSSHPLRER